MNWQAELNPEEMVLWEGRPAPRCYTFRNWRHSIFGILFLLLATWWEAVGMQMSAVYELPWLAWLPIPFVVFGLYLGLLHHLVARLEWDRVGYLITDRRILVRRGFFRPRQECLEMDQVSYFRLKPLGESLGSFQIYGETAQDRVALLCIEYPRRVVDLLETAMKDRACPLSERPKE